MSNHPSVDQALQWLSGQPEITHIRAGLYDLNGILRGKMIPVAQAKKALSGGLRMPLSCTSGDVWSDDLVNSTLVFETGDGDGVLEWTGRNFLTMDWMTPPTALLPLWLAEESGAPFLADPRRALAHVIEQYHQLGLKPVVATELEFYLVDPSTVRPIAPLSPVTGKRLDANGVLSVDAIDQFDGFFADVYQACEQMGVSADAAISEGGAGQYEINLLHCDDALAAADEAMMFKRIVKGVARKHKIMATFMAKPYPDRAGSGLHVHFSLLDNKGKNIFDDGSDNGSRTMRHAVAGMLGAMAGSMLVFAPHLNSYRRLNPTTHAPGTVSWGYENRHAAIRIPAGASQARRIEHRVAGADANPYLVLAAILGAALVGIKAKKSPPEPATGNEFPAGVKALPGNWLSAIEAFEANKNLPQIFSPLLLELFAAVKKQEYSVFAGHVSDFEYDAYLEIL